MTTKITFLEKNTNMKISIKRSETLKDRLSKSYTEEIVIWKNNRMIKYIYKMGLLKMRCISMVLYLGDDYDTWNDIDTSMLILGIGNDGYKYIGGRTSKIIKNNDIHIKMYDDEDTDDEIEYENMKKERNKNVIFPIYMKKSKNNTGIHTFFDIGNTIHENIIKSPTYTPEKILSSSSMYRILDNIFTYDINDIDNMLF